MRLVEEPWFNRLNIDFAKPGEARVLFGFLKQDPDNAEIARLYLTLDLDDYIEFRAADALGSHSLENLQNPLGGTVVWVKRSAQLKWISAENRTEQGTADFIRGAIVDRHLGGAGLGGLNRWVQLLTWVFLKPTTQSVGCPVTSMFTCASVCPPCLSYRCQVQGPIVPE